MKTSLVPPRGEMLPLVAVEAAIMSLTDRD